MMLIFNQSMTSRRISGKTLDPEEEEEEEEGVFWRVNIIWKFGARLSLNL